MISFKIREDIFQSLINNGSAVMVFRGGTADNYTINEKEGGVPYREIVFTKSLNENELEARVIMLSNRLLLDDNKAFEVMIDDIVAWNAISITDGQTNNLIK